MTPKEFENYIRENWDKFDGCGSCGWKSALYEQEPLRIEQFEIDRGYVRLPCFSEDSSQNGGHRGMRIYVPTEGESAK
jgi:hypothetical protein